MTVIQLHWQLYDHARPTGFTGRRKSSQRRCASSHLDRFKIQGILEAVALASELFRICYKNSKLFFLTHNLKPVAEIFGHGPKFSAVVRMSVGNGGSPARGQAGKL